MFYTGWYLQCNIYNCTWRGLATTCTVRWEIVQLKNFDELELESKSKKKLIRLWFRCIKKNIWMFPKCSCELLTRDMLRFQSFTKRGTETSSLTEMFLFVSTIQWCISSFSFLSVRTHFRLPYLVESSVLFSILSIRNVLFHLNICAFQTSYPKAWLQGRL